MDQFIVFFSTLAGFVPVVVAFAPLVSYLVDIAKRIGLPNGYAPVLSGLLNVAAWVLVFFSTDEQIANYPNVVSGILAVAPYIVALVASLLATPLLHDALTAKGFGYSHRAG